MGVSYRYYLTSNEHNHQAGSSETKSSLVVRNARSAYVEIFSYINKWDNPKVIREYIKMEIEEARLVLTMSLLIECLILLCLKYQTPTKLSLKMLYMPFLKPFLKTPPTQISDHYIHWATGLHYMGRWTVCIRVCFVYLN